VAAAAAAAAQTKQCMQIIIIIMMLPNSQLLQHRCNIARHMHWYGGRL
jgi:hypothetical protein